MAGAQSRLFRQLAEHLSELVDGLTYLTRRSGKSKESASALIRQALFNTEYRLRHHKIQVVNGLEHGDSDFTIFCTRRLIIATLMNLMSEQQLLMLVVVFWDRSRRKNAWRAK